MIVNLNIKKGKCDAYVAKTYNSSRWMLFLTLFLLASNLFKKIINLMELIKLIRVFVR